MFFITRMLTTISVRTPPPPILDTYERFDFPEPDDAMFPPDTAEAAATDTGSKQKDEEDEAREEQGEQGEQVEEQEDQEAEEDSAIGNAVVSLAPFFSFFFFFSSNDSSAQSC